MHYIDQCLKTFENNLEMSTTGLFDLDLYLLELKKLEIQPIKNILLVIFKFLLDMQLILYKK